MLCQRLQKLSLLDLHAVSKTDTHEETITTPELEQDTNRAHTIAQVRAAWQSKSECRLKFVASEGVNVEETVIDEGFSFAEVEVHESFNSINVYGNALHTLQSKGISGTGSCQNILFAYLDIKEIISWWKLHFALPMLEKIQTITFVDNNLNWAHELENILSLCQSITEASINDDLY